MPLIKSTDLFIQRSLNLLLTDPSQTHISITYGSKSKKDSKKANKVTKPDSEDQNKSFVSFKVYNPISGSLYKLKTTKSKDLSRILTALGPHGVQASKGEEVIPVRGFSSVLANTEVPAYEEEQTNQEPQQTQQSQTGASNSGTSSKKSKKKKGKK